MYLQIIDGYGENHIINDIAKPFNIKIEVGSRPMCYLDVYHDNIHIITHSPTWNNIAYIKWFCDHPKDVPNKENIKYFIKILGFVPYYKMINEERKFYQVIEYPPSNPETFTIFMGIKLMTAIVNFMELATGMKESIGTNNIELDYFPEHLRPHVMQALEKLSAPYGVGSANIQDLAVYNFLGILHLFEMQKVFIYNNTFYEYNGINVAQYSPNKHPTILHYKYTIDLYAGANLDNFITNDIYRLTELYQKLKKQYSKLNTHEANIMKLFLYDYKKY